MAPFCQLAVLLVGVLCPASIDPALCTGGRGVIEGLGKQLALPDRKLEPSYASLYWYGNTSSASTWYGLAFVEAVQRVRCGERVWQVRSPSLRPVWDRPKAARELPVLGRLELFTLACVQPCPAHRRHEGCFLSPWLP